MKLTKAIKTRVKNLNKPTPAKWVKNLNKPTPAKWVKIGLSLTAISAAINGYGLTQGIQWVSYLGLACLVGGTLIANMFADTTEPTNEQ